MWVDDRATSRYTLDMAHREEGDKTVMLVELRPVNRDMTSAVEKSGHILQQVCADHF